MFELLRPPVGGCDFGGIRAIFSIVIEIDETCGKFRSFGEGVVCREVCREWCDSGVTVFGDRKHRQWNTLLWSRSGLPAVRATVRVIGDQATGDHEFLSTPLMREDDVEREIRPAVCFPLRFDEAWTGQKIVL